jgi:hypothetical protein
MKLLCLKDFNHGHLPEGHPLRKGANKNKEYATEYKAGTYYEVEDDLALRFLRDFGPKTKDAVGVCFQAVDQGEPERVAAALAAEAQARNEAVATKDVADAEKAPEGSA